METKIPFAIATKIYFDIQNDRNILIKNVKIFMGKIIRTLLKNTNTELSKWKAFSEDSA